MIRLFTSNRLEILADALAKVLEKPLATPLAKELILVQSKGMEKRWISLQTRREARDLCKLPLPFFERLCPGDVPGCPQVPHPILAFSIRE